MSFEEVLIELADNKWCAYQWNVKDMESKIRPIYDRLNALVEKWDSGPPALSYEAERIIKEIIGEVSAILHGDPSDKR